MVNYFTDIVGATQEAFERGRARSQGVRQQIGESRAARALASGNYAAAKEAYGRAGMAPQVEALNERQRGMEEAERRRQREAVMQGREDESYMREQEKYARDIAKGQFEALGQYANALAQVPYEQRKEAWNRTLRPAVIAMGIPEQAIAQIDAADLNDQNLQMFMQAAGMEMEKLDAVKPIVTVSQRGATVYDPATGTARFIPAEGAPPEAARDMTPYQAAMLALRTQEFEEEKFKGERIAEEKLMEKRRIMTNTFGQLSEGVALIDELVNSSGFNKIYGKVNAAKTTDDPNDTIKYLATPQDALNSLALLEQVSGQAFLGGVQQMRGLGPLSEREGVAVQRAITSLSNRSQDPAAARAAAQKFRASLERLITAAQQESGMSRQELMALLGQAPAAPATTPETMRGLGILRPGAPGAAPNVPAPAQGGAGSGRRVQSYAEWAKENGVE